MNTPARRIQAPGAASRRTISLRAERSIWWKVRCACIRRSSARALPWRFASSGRPRKRARNFRDGAVALARLMLYAQARDLEKRIGGNAQLLLSAVPYFTRDALVETLLDLVFRRACFADGRAAAGACGVRRGARSRSRRAAFEPRGDRVGRDRLVRRRRATCAACWMIRAREDARRGGAGEPRRISSALLDARVPAIPLGRLAAAGCRAGCGAKSAAGSAHWPAASEPAPLLAELREWERRCESLGSQAGAELRRPPELDALRLWIEEYRVSLYAQDLKTVGPVSAARLVERAAAHRGLARPLSVRRVRTPRGRSGYPAREAAYSSS